MVSQVFDRTPYKVEYYKDGQKHVIRRTPPPKLHDMLTGDSVKILQKKNDDWNTGDTVKIKNINPRQPNFLTLEKSNGDYTFIIYDEVSFKRRPGKDGQGSGSEDDTQYLLWP
jgi:hypothetical protein